MLIDNNKNKLNKMRRNSNLPSLQHSSQKNTQSKGNMKVIEDKISHH